MVWDIRSFGLQHIKGLGFFGFKSCKLRVFLGECLSEMALREARFGLFEQRNAYSALKKKKNKTQKG